MNYGKPFSGRKIFYSLLIGIFTICSCLWFLFDSYSIYLKENIYGTKEFEGIVGFNIKGTEAISGKYCKFIQGFIDEEMEYYNEYGDDYYYNNDNYSYVDYDYYDDYYDYYDYDDYDYDYYDDYYDYYDYDYYDYDYYDDYDDYDYDYYDDYYDYDYDDYDYYDDYYDNDIKEMKDVLSLVKSLRTISIIIMIVMIVMALAEIFMLSLVRNKTGYVIIMLTSAVKLLLLTIMGIVLSMKANGIEVDGMKFNFSFDFGIIFLIFMQIMQIVICIGLIMVHKAEDKIFRINCGME